VLALNGKDVWNIPLVERKRLLRAIVPKRSASILFKHQFSAADTPRNESASA
jgi:ATP-dependent DNA ligase